MSRLVLLLATHASGGLFPILHVGVKRRFPIPRRRGESPQPTGLRALAAKGLSSEARFIKLAALAAEMDGHGRSLRRLRSGPGFIAFRRTHAIFRVAAAGQSVRLGMKQLNA
jgi:hypothetical protein